MFARLIAECRFVFLHSGALDESVLKNILDDPAVHVAGVAYHRKAASQAKDPKIRARHLAQIKHHSKEAERLRRQTSTRDEGAGDPDLHSKGVDLLKHMDLAPGPNPPPKWYRDEMPAKKKKRKPKEEYGSPGMGYST